MQKLAERIYKTSKKVENEKIIDENEISGIIEDYVDVANRLACKELKIAHTPLQFIQYSLTFNQIMNRIDKNGFSMILLIENLIECSIYQYKKRFNNNSKLNKFLRNDLKRMMVDYTALEVYKNEF